MRQMPKKKSPKQMRRDFDETFGLCDPNPNDAAKAFVDAYNALDDDTEEQTIINVPKEPASLETLDKMIHTNLSDFGIEEPKKVAPKRIKWHGLTIHFNKDGSVSWTP